MTQKTSFDVIIVGGSYSGLAAGMALGRALISVMIIDNGKPCNEQTPHSHNFLTQDGNTPSSISILGRSQVKAYDSIKFFGGTASTGRKTDNGFEIQVASGQRFNAEKLIFATGIRDIFPDLNGFARCWGISILHCPYCHGYEVRNEPTGILGNGAYGYEFSKLISNWTNDLTLFTNGPSTLTDQQTQELKDHKIEIIEKELSGLEERDGYIRHLIFNDGTKSPIKAVYTQNPFEQHCKIPAFLGCGLTEDGYIIVDSFQKTTVDGISACGDNVTRMRTVANAVAMGTTAGMTVSKEMILEKFMHGA